MEFLFLGPLEVHRHGGKVPVTGRKERTLLLALLLRANEVVSRDRLVDSLWGDEPPGTATDALYVHVSHLRKALGADVLVTGPGGYEVRADPESIDARRFERLAREGRQALADGAAEVATACLSEALALWRGPALGELAAEPFAAAEAARLEELRLAVLEDRVDADLAAGRHAGLVGELEALLAEHPLRERLWAQLMRALYADGRQAEALEAYRRVRATLAAELGIEPTPALRLVERTILRHDVSPEAPARVRAAAPLPLPTPTTPLLGREAELAEVAALLGRDDVRVVTLTGPGGIGKTRLALEATRRIGATRPGSVAFVPLGAIADPAFVDAAIEHALGLGADESLASALAGAELLLCLDNFEQLLSAAPRLADLLASAPGLKLLVTSRAVLRLTGEREYPVPPLGDADGAAVDLLVQRARAVLPGFELTSENAAVLTAICARLEGLPLAIELAAGRIKLLPPPALLARLTSQLELLTAGARDLPERQQTMRATIEWSCRLLEPRERAVFAQLAVFVGGAPLEAIEAVVGGDALDVLGVLVDNSLVRPSGDAAPRFRMLEVVREYALEELAADPEESAVRQRHALYFLALACEAESELEAQRQQEWLDRLELEHPNLRTALDFALAAGDRVEALRAAVGMRRFWLLRGHLAEGRSRLDDVLATGAGDPTERSAALNGAGFLAAEQGDFDAAERRFEESVALAREGGDTARIASPLANLGVIAVFRGDVDRAIDLFTEALELYGDISEDRRAVTALENLGTAYAVKGETRRAVELLEQALAAARSLGHARLIGSTLRSLGRTLAEANELKRAREAVEEALLLDRALGELQGVADCLEILGGIAAGEGVDERTAELYGAAAVLRESIGSRRHPDQERWLLGVQKAARAALGPDAFAAAETRGRALSLDDAIELALRGL